MDKLEIDYFLNVGKAIAYIEEILDNELFENLSKHNEYWQDKDDDERLNDTRCRLSYINERLWQVMSLLNNEKDE